MRPDSNGEAGTDAPTFRVAHLSDIHFGKISQPGIVPALVDEVNAENFDLVVISGDLTQRARDREFRPAAAMINSIAAPTLVVPGNHDVPPWWRPVHRLTDHSGPFRKFISDESTPSFSLGREGRTLAVFGVDSSHGMSIAGGKIRPEHLDRMASFFEPQPETSFRILTVHHQLTRMKEVGPHDVARGASKALRRTAQCNVELVLCGHLHLSHVAHIDVDIKDGHRIVVASAGTATSNRGRGSNRMVNFYNHIEVWPDRFSVQERRYDPGSLRFVAERTTPFARARVLERTAA